MPRPPPLHLCRPIIRIQTLHHLPQISRFYSTTPPTSSLVGSTSPLSHLRPITIPQPPDTNTEDLEDEDTPPTRQYTRWIIPLLLIGTTASLFSPIPEESREEDVWYQRPMKRAVMGYQVLSIDHHLRCVRYAAKEGMIASTIKNS
jgi:hypothetical protein